MNPILNHNKDYLPIRNGVVYVVDDDKAIRDSLGYLLKSNGFTASCHESAERFMLALSSASPFEVACALFDINMSGMSGVDLQSRLIEDGINLPIAFITGHGEISLAVQTLKKGAHDFIEKPVKEEVVCAIIREMLNKSYLIKEQDKQMRDAQSKLQTLTKRERQVLDCIVEGCTNKQAAARLNISLKTVEAHRANVMDKLGVNRAASLLKLAITHKE